MSTFINSPVLASLARAGARDPFVDDLLRKTSNNRTENITRARYLY